MKKLLSRLYLFILLTAGSILGNQCMAQSLSTPDSLHIRTTDTTQKTSPAVRAAKGPRIDEDSLAFALKPHPYQPNPKKSGMYAAIFPGLGQAYNHQYWKIPIVYAGFGIAGYFIVKNSTEYQSFRKAYIGRLPPNSNFTDEYVGIYDGAQLKQLQDERKKYLDMTVLFTGIGYFVQILDAITSAHLKNFDISRDISMHMQPVAMPYNGVGLALVMNFK